MKKTGICVLITAIIGFALYYVFLPALNPSSFGFWVFLIILLGIYAFLDLMVRSKGIHLKISGFTKYALIGSVILVIGIILLDIVNSPMIRANAYANRIEINQSGNFYEDVDEVNFNHIPLLDKDSSQKLGDRVMGQLPELVSQFYVSDIYTQINYNNDIIRVTPLEYDGIIKYFNNRKDGVKGYITVNSVNGESKLVKLDEGMKYMPSAFFNDNLYRHVRFAYPTAILGEATFELDNDGNPYWIFPTISYTGVGLKKEINGVIMVDPISGDMERYDVNDVPSWIDHVYSPSLIIEQVDDWGLYNGGFFNSIFGQRNVVATTDGYNYIIMNDDVYLYTGITSIASDESNLGFILTNLRTKETNFYSVPGAEEFSAMASAEGQVQQMAYEASFPLLINLNGKATYLISLKDYAGLVKMYAFVDVADYQKVVVTEASLGIEQAAKNYLGDAATEVEISYDTKSFSAVITDIKEVTIKGTTYYYLMDTDGNKYRVAITVDELNLPFMDENSRMNGLYYENQSIKEITEITSIVKEIFEIEEN